MMMKFGKIPDCSKSVEFLGAKGYSLNALYENGFPVPKGFIIPSDDLLDLPGESLKRMILDEYKSLDSDLVAVRSSSTVEDSLAQSFAGQFDSFLNVGKDEIFDSMGKCLASRFSPRVEAYSKKTGDIGMAIIIQKMLHPDFAGVAFSMNPVDRNADVIVVEAVAGNGQALAQGEVTPDFFEVSKSSFEIVNGSKIVESKIDNLVIIEIARLTKRVSDFFDYPADVEWAVVQGTLYLLQSRPITTR